MLDAIYYPSYLPSKEWFKTQLLLWNRIYRIVPDPMESVFGAKKISSEWGLPEEYVQTLPVAVLDMNYLNQRKRAIIKQLKWLSTLKKDLPGNLPDWLVRVLKELDSEGFYTDAPFYLNTGKVPDWVGTKLLEYGLRRREKVDIYNNEHYVIRQDAAELLMSCLTHTMAAHRNMSPLTNR
ncbi:MAG: hypothetical protein KJ927_20255 [Candidatus Eisenbacteria bacterium]|nr:hypothetical protein [Candidatus Eisenbacteria bacterium]